MHVSAGVSEEKALVSTFTVSLDIADYLGIAFIMLGGSRAEQW